MTGSGSGNSVEHFAQSLPAGEDQSDIPRLLRAVADSVAELGGVEILDMILSCEWNEIGPWPAMTVYYHQLAPEV